MRWLIWSAVALALAVPVVLSLASPLLAYRQPVYIAAGLAGVLALCALLIQPLLAGGALCLSPITSRWLHRITGASLVGLTLVHVGGLWITSPPDVVDALLLRSPTQFSLWGVIAMWAVFATALAAALRRHLRPRVWRWGHRALALVIAGGTIAHALLIDGTMEPWSKALLCVAVALAAAFALLSRQPWRWR
ncbi:ferric reductase-like transmembrane domain-containing protein [Sulfitobacter albidus]|uniref:Ferric reductase-like transmembrane domain-containing protein n=1 Tax=Sulfitobacter albidus TaxID=2829501 RepID=A0A975JBQ6_9RHOB|nr:ferric reductase-like transmembrane domain-containing protein [Sulfitobacter albidus]QUJ75325.1 ferric reductase-like transmembrane domain-containing protein [Sulfitobacter albidus]